MRSAFALRMIQRKIFYTFGIPERLRTLRDSIFTGGVVEENGIYSGCTLFINFYNLWNMLKFFPSAD